MRFMMVYLEINYAGANNTQVDRLKTTMTSKLYTAPEDNTWKLLHQSTNEVYLESNGCSNQPLCNSTQLLRLEPVTYHQYMMVVTFPRNFSPKAKILKINAKAIFQTKRFTLTFIGIRLVPTLILLITTFWFHNVISHLPSKTALHRSIILLGITTALVDFPFELIVMFFDAGWLLAIIRLLTQANYAALLIFWVVFMDQHKVNNHPKRQLRLRIYIGTICVFLSLQAVANLTIQGLVLANPFNINLTLNLVEAFLGVVMFGYLLANLFAEAASFISASDTSVCGVLPLTMRLRLLIIHFIITDVVTVIYSILTEIYKMDVKGSSCSGLYTITFYLWNIQAFVIMILYSPRKSEIPNQALQEQ
uniref:Wntless-like transmembrane domain-containing protein n=2 Tax=Ciona intestinalis TaxID=7719 RepID=H2XTV9_CIOIN